MRDASAETVARALAAFPLEAPTWDRVTRGLINQTFAITAKGGRYVLQRLNPIFAAEVNRNVRAVTEHLAKKGLATPRLIATRAGGAWTDLGQDGTFRLLTWIDGATFDVAESSAQLHAAGELVGRFHAALRDLEYRFVGLRAGVHDLARHLAKLGAVLAARWEHRLFAPVDELGGGILAAASRLAPPRDLTPCIGHGDLKLNNVRFAGEHGGAREQAVCLLDLDTVGPQSLAFEIGDAWRSWCNPAGEDASREVRFDLDGFAASLQGYREGLGRALDAREREDLLDGVEWVSLELAARFAADALEESYFGWDPARHPTRGDHNLARARTQLALHRAARECRAERERMLLG